MKKEIMNLITSSEGQFRINNISYLKRWTKDGKPNPQSTEKYYNRLKAEYKI